MKTELGTLTLQLDPTLAPQTVAHITTLVKAGAYDGTHIFRVEPGFVAQISPVTDRQPPLSAAQLALVQNVPLEASSTLKHHRGTLSMARWPDKPMSGESSFSILLGDAPHLDGQYTIIGTLVKGEDVLKKIETVERVPGTTRPVTRLTLLKVELIPDQAIPTPSPR